MASVRNKFHELGNWHNKISLGAMVTKDALKDKDIAQLSQEDIKKLFEKVVKTLGQIDEFIIAADKTVDDLKPYVYENLDPDAEIPLKKE